MNQLFYSESDDTLFSVMGYTMDTSTDNVAKKVQSLQKNAVIFAMDNRCNWEDVKTLVVKESSKYKQMRVFYIEKPTYISKDVFRLNSDWTMEKWLKN